jgi:ribokinase
MKCVNFGSVNIDHVYQTSHFVQPGETLPASSYQLFPGGKGYNQSIALARSGVEVYHAGMIGYDGVWLKDQLQVTGADVSLLKTVDQPTGHAVIQVTPDGENSIIIYGGANQAIDDQLINTVFSSLESGDTLLLQNEIAEVGRIMGKSIERKIKLVFNPAPMTDQIKDYPLHLVNTFILNEIEAFQLTGFQHNDEIIQSMRERYPASSVVLTLGSDGVIYSSNHQVIEVTAKKVEAVDTTAAGDTFIGYFLGGIMSGKDIEKGLETACIAAAICVTKEGAASSIPDEEEIARFI